MPRARTGKRRRPAYTWTRGDWVLLTFALMVLGPLSVTSGVVAHLVWRWVSLGWGWS